MLVLLSAIMVVVIVVLPVSVHYLLRDWNKSISLTITSLHYAAGTLGG